MDTVRTEARKIEDVKDAEIVDTFRGISHDLATCARDAGETSIHIDDAADATFNAFHPRVAYTATAFPKIKAVLRKTFCSGRSKKIEF